MKTIILFILLFTTLLFSQTNYYPDKLVSKHGVSQKCYIMEINTEFITTKARNNSRTKFFLSTVDKITIDDLGTVYTTLTGFKMQVDSISVFLSDRNLNYFLPNEPQNTILRNNAPLFNSNRRFFFAVNYFPSLTKQLVFTYSHYIYRPSPYSSHDLFYQPIYFELEQNLVSMESQLGFNIANNLFMTLSFGYSSDLYKSSSTTTEILSWDGSTNTRVNENQNSMDKFLFEIGLKRYFGSFKIRNVNPFVFFSVGKQIAFSDNYNRTYYRGQVNDQVFTNNENEFMEGLNSPIFVSLGFGAEYFIAESLSLSGFIKAKYSSASSTYKWENTNNGDFSDRGNEDVENKSVRYKTGLGLNFFF